MLQGSPGLLAGLFCANVEGTLVVLTSFLAAFPFKLAYASASSFFRCSSSTIH
jgi:hypothetical protein